MTLRSQIWKTPWGNETYPGEIVLHGDRVTGYLSACLAGGVWAIRQQLNSKEYKDALGYDDSQELDVDMMFPIRRESWPYVQVMWVNDDMMPVSLEEKRLVNYIGDDGNKAYDQLNMYRFEGHYTVVVFANTVLERERISDAIIGALGIDDRFRDLMYDNPYINIAPNMHTLDIGAATESLGSPWDDNLVTCSRRLYFKANGEFTFRRGVIPTFLTAIEASAYIVKPDLTPDDTFPDGSPMPSAGARVDGTSIKFM